MKIGYIRVSTTTQNTARQQVAMDDIGLDKIFEEKISGKNMDRPQLQQMLEYVRDGDVVYIESISRLGRSLKDLIDIVEILNNKNVGLVSLKESVIDTTSPSGKLIFSIFASLAEFERETTRQRQLEGIAIAKADGKYKGRKRIQLVQAEWDKVIRKWQAGEITAVKAMEILGVSRNTFYRRVKESGITGPPML